MEVNQVMRKFCILIDLRVKQIQNEMNVSKKNRIEKKKQKKNKD